MRVTRRIGRDDRFTFIAPAAGACVRVALNMDGIQFVDWVFEDALKECLEDAHKQSLEYWFEKFHTPAKPPEWAWMVNQATNFIYYGSRRVEWENVRSPSGLAYLMRRVL